MVKQAETKAILDSIGSALYYGCRSVSGKGVIRPSELLRLETDAQDLKSCEGFPPEGSSPSPGTLLTRVSAQLSLPDSPPQYPNCA